MHLCASLCIHILRRIDVLRNSSDRGYFDNRKEREGERLDIPVGHSVKRR